MRARKWATGLSLVAVLAVASIAASSCVSVKPPPATWNHPRVDVAAEYYFGSWISQARAHWGGYGLPSHGTLVDKARSWSNWMGVGGCYGSAAICHSQLSSGVSGRVASWSLLGENVGVGSCSNLRALWNAFMSSSGHRANILDPRWSFIGVGVTRHGSRCYVTMEFMRA